MRLTKGQSRTLQKMDVDVQTVTEAALKMFFDYTDRGIQPPLAALYIHRECAGDWYCSKAQAYLQPYKEFGILCGIFMNTSRAPKIWQEDMAKGLLFPQDFVDVPLGLFEAAVKQDSDAMGFERRIWELVRLARLLRNLLTSTRPGLKV